MENRICGDQHYTAGVGKGQPHQAVSGNDQAGALFRRDSYNAALAADGRRNVKVSLGIKPRPR